MSKQISRDELEKVVHEAVRKINIEDAAHTAPVYSLTEILELKKVTALRKLGKTLRVKYYSKLSKPLLAAAIAEIVQQVMVLRDFIFFIDEKEWAFFQRVAAKKHLQTDKVFIDAYSFCQSLGLLQSFYYQDKLYYVVPGEIKAAYRELVKTGFPEEKRHGDLLHNYAVAAVSLYGAISQDDFVALFNSQNERKTSIDEMYPVLLSYVCMKAGYCFWKEYIVDDGFEEDDFRGVTSLIAARNGKPRYTPPRDELLKYSDWDYYEMTPQLAALKARLSELIPDHEKVSDLLDDIQELCAAEVRLQEIFDRLDAAEVVFDTMEQANVVIPLIIDVKNNTRLWSNYGHTPSELSATKKSNLLPFPSVQPVRVQKTGRNEPCPCGSGKKHKHCCGR